jgi:hypothetical protein
MAAIRRPGHPSRRWARLLILVVAVASLLARPSQGVRAAPANDNLASAQPLSGSCGGVASSNVGATREAAEPLIQGNPGGASLWYRWTAPATTMVSVDTVGSTAYTLLAVYTGTTLTTFPQLKLVAATGALTMQNQLTFPVFAGASYALTIDGYKGMTGTLALRWRDLDAPPNDCFAFAAALPTTMSPSGPIETDIVGATRETGEPAPAPLSTSSVWYRWTAPATNPSCSKALLAACPYLTIDTFNSTFDTVLAVYTGGSVDTLALIAANDDCFPSYCSFPSLQSQVTFHYLGGVTYQIAAMSYANAPGLLRLHWGIDLPPNPGANSPATGASRPGETVRIVTTCSDPDGWRDIATIDFRVQVGGGRGAGEPQALLAQFDQDRNVLRLYDPDAGTWSEGTPGSGAVLSTRYADLHLADSAVQGAGPTAPSVAVTWALVFKEPAAHPNYRQELRITDDAGVAWGWERVGTWTVTR